jgi:hypothetical protein
MDGDTQPSRPFDRRLLLLAVAFVLAAAAIWASSSLAGGSGPPSPAKAKATVSQVDRGLKSGGFHTGGTGGSKERCPFEGHQFDSSDV